MAKLKKYIRNLIELINLERDAEISTMTHEMTVLSGEEREELGRAIVGLRAQKLGKELGLQIVQFTKHELLETEISVGNMVLISEGDDPLKSDFKGVVSQRSDKYIKVAFNRRIRNWEVKKNVRMDLYANDITFKRMHDNLKQLTQSGRDALEYLLGNKKPKRDRPIPQVDFSDDNLNDSQKEAIRHALACESFFLIHGPFGTGKTRTLVELILQESKQNNKILTTAESNAAVDNILERLKTNTDLNVTRLGNPQRVSHKNIQETLAYKAEHHVLSSKLEDIDKKIQELNLKRKSYIQPFDNHRKGLSDMDIIHKAYKGEGANGISPEKMESMANWIEISKEIDESYDNLKNTEKSIISDIIDKSDVILSTNSSAALDFIADVEFDVAIVDEASQTTIPSVLIPIAKAKRFILAGDHKQLPPTILSDNAGDLEKTLFEGLINKYPSKSRMLNIQYRMNSILMEFPNQEFYQNKLHSDSSVDDITINELIKSPHFETPMQFIDTSGIKKNHEKRLSGSTSIINIAESKLCVKLARKFLNYGLSVDDIGIISFYDDQVRMINRRTPVEVKTVDGFQGREKELIIISTVRSNNHGHIGFLKDMRRLNVAITRAKRKLIIVGNAETLKSNRMYLRFIQFMQDEDFFKTFTYI